jgi:hypothetical protein
MQKLFRTCVIASCVSVLLVLIWANTGLALTTRGYCVVRFTIPFTDDGFQLPNWMWPTLMSACVISTLIAIVLWTALLIKRTRLRSGSLSKA